VRRPHNAPGKLDNADYPPYTIGLATDLLGVQPVRHCCIEAKGVLTMPQSSEADPSGTLRNHNKPGI
jgi:hypothetical protein